MGSEQNHPGSSTNDEAQVTYLEGGCCCKHIRYRIVSKPLVVHCCHCRWCQRETGSAFALNAMIEANRVIHLGPEPELSKVPSESGVGQTIARCPKCFVALWSNYDGPLIRFVRAGTLDKPAYCPPDVHIFTASKQPWVILPEGVLALEKTYTAKEDVWPKESLKRWEIFLEKVRTWEARKEKEAGEENGS